jgi:uncharacterized protein
MSNSNIVRQIYRDFAAGNAAAILEVFADDVEFRLAEGHPYRGSSGAWIGTDAVVANFFTVAGPEWDGWSIGVETILEAPDTVVVEARYTGTYKPTSRTMNVQVCHIWRFHDGKISSFHQYVDTAALQRVMGRQGGTS